MPSNYGQSLIVEQDPTAAGHRFELAGREVHIWTTPLDAPDPMVAHSMAILSSDETKRMRSFRFEHLQRSYAVSQGFWSTLLGRYASVAPTEVQFSYASKGKPSLAGISARIAFNSAHSAGLGLYAVTTDCEVGVDIEHARDLPDMENIARQFFGSEEATDLLSLPAQKRIAGFYNCWTRKEAFVKAVGEGLFMPLDSFRVTLAPGQPAELMHVLHDRLEAGQWTLTDLTAKLAEGVTSLGCPPEQFAAALAYRDTPRPLAFRFAKSVRDIDPPVA
jgi:4'-phosphopantetheinyl transferase